MHPNSLLPAPVHQHPAQDYDQHQYSTTMTVPTVRIPPYGQRKGWKPKKPEDFGDGGAFPEIHIAQYPLDMGRKKKVCSISYTISFKYQSSLLLPVGRLVIPITPILTFCRLFIISNQK